MSASRGHVEAVCLEPHQRAACFTRFAFAMIILYSRFALLSIEKHKKTDTKRVFYVLHKKRMFQLFNVPNLRKYDI